MADESRIIWVSPLRLTEFIRLKLSHNLHCTGSIKILWQENQQADYIWMQQ